jgi:hypothetical protein
MDLLAETHWRSAVRYLGSSRRQFEQNYETPLLRERRLLGSTVPIAENASLSEPMMFQFTMMGEGGERRGHNLALRDVAGEDLENSDADPVPFSFFARADGVFMLLDPLKVDVIYRVLQDKIPQVGQLGGDALHVMYRVLELMNTGLGSATRVPMAVVLSKFDVVQALSEVEGTTYRDIMIQPGSGFQRDHSLDSADYDETDGALLHEETRSLLETLGATNVVTLLHESAHVFRYFVTSALGHQPVGLDLPDSDIAPFRVLDPLKWVLAQRGAA